MILSCVISENEIQDLFHVHQENQWGCSKFYSIFVFTVICTTMGSSDKFSILFGTYRSPVQHFSILILWVKISSTIKNEENFSKFEICMWLINYRSMK